MTCHSLHITYHLCVTTYVSQLMCHNLCVTTYVSQLMCHNWCVTTNESYVPQLMCHNWYFLKILLGFYHNRPASWNHLRVGQEVDGGGPGRHHRGDRRGRVRHDGLRRVLPDDDELNKQTNKSGSLFFFRQTFAQFLVPKCQLWHKCALAVPKFILLNFDNFLKESYGMKCKKCRSLFSKVFGKVALGSCLLS